MEVRHDRTGLLLFGIYLFIYSGFVLLNAFWPDVMAWTPIAGVNLAILYGFALILIALVMALIYGWFCTPPVYDDPPPGNGTVGPTPGTESRP